MSVELESSSHEALGPEDETKLDKDDDIHVPSCDSIFSAPCWISPLYFSTSISGDKKEAPQTPEEVREEKEALGWTLDAAARGVAVMGTAVFVSTELLRLATIAAGCDMAEECYSRVYGMRPSSILSNIVTVVGLFSAFIMPLIGSIIDHTTHRKTIGSASAAALAIFILVQALVIEEHWFAAAILQIFVAFTYTIHLCSVYAYLPELTPDHDKMVQYTARFSAAQYGGSVFFLATMVILLTTFNHEGRFASTYLSQAVIFAVLASFLGYAWTKLFQKRPAKQSVPDGQNLLSSGFATLCKTGQTILKEHHALKWLLVAVSFTEAAATTFSTVAITYMTHVLGFAPNENGIAILILLLFGVPGTRVAAFLSKRYNPIRSLQACLALWIVNTTAAAVFLRGPGQQYLAYFFAMVWGIATGWIYPSEKTLYVTIIPKGQEGELMGLYICASQILSWLPPLVFTVMNEAGVPMSVGMFTLTIYFMISYMLLNWVGDYDEAVDHAKTIDAEKASAARTPTAGIAMDGYGCYQGWAEEDDGCYDNGVDTINFACSGDLFYDDSGTSRPEESESHNGD